MTASAKGTVDAPGQNVRPKAGLYSFILATGWSGLHAILVYKAPQLIAVDPRHTSQTCAAWSYPLIRQKNPAIHPIKFRLTAKDGVDAGERLIDLG